MDHRWDSLSGGYDYPPARINDLTVTRVNRKDRKVSLSWTATGSNLDNGRGILYMKKENVVHVCQLINDILQIAISNAFQLSHTRFVTTPMEQLLSSILRREC